MSVVNFKETLTNLKTFVEQNGFDQPWENVFFIKSRFVEESQIPLKHLVPSEEFEEIFEKTLSQSHSWINIHFLGLIGEFLIITIEEPNYQNNAKFTSMNFSLPESKITNWDASEFYELTD